MKGMIIIGSTVHIGQAHGCDQAVTFFGQRDTLPSPPPSNPHPFTSQPVHEANPLHPDPGPHHA